MSCKSRIEALEKMVRSKKQVIVVRDGEVLTVCGEQISEARLEELRETAEVVILNIVVPPAPELES